MVTGTLAQPDLSLDPGSVLTEGGTAVATLGWSLFAAGFVDRFMSPKDPCGHALIDANKDLLALEKKYRAATD